MKNKIIEIISSHLCHGLDETDVYIDKDVYSALIDKIQALEFPVTVKEVKEHCSKIGFDCEECIIEGRDCPINDHPQKWNIDKITKAVRHE